MDLPLTKKIPPDEQIISAAKVAEVYDNIIEFPNGFDTILGERGVTLSGGAKTKDCYSSSNSKGWTNFNIR